ncbi:MAG: hypothetical protein NDI61_12510 [Bdellovibrionaceae bacterium]|nr:hypothetical protein [Pseudobdellovibrionaceae bacterium]
MTQADRKRWLFGLATCVFLFFTTSIAASPTQTDPDIVMRESMVIMARQLGVTCTHCHDPKNFKSATMKTHQKAKEHMRVTAWLNSQNGLAGKPHIDCYTCHRGEPSPKPEKPTPKK